MGIFNCKQASKIGVCIAIHSKFFGRIDDEAFILTSLEVFAVVKDGFFMDVLGAMGESGKLVHSKGYLRMAIASQIHEYSYNQRVAPLVLILSGFASRIRSQRNW